MPRLTPLTRRQFLEKLARLGFGNLEQGGDHIFLYHKGTKIKIPNSHSQKDIPVFIIQKTLNLLDISREEWLKK